MKILTLLLAISCIISVHGPGITSDVIMSKENINQMLFLLCCYQVRQLIMSINHHKINNKTSAKGEDPRRSLPNLIYLNKVYRPTKLSAKLNINAIKSSNY